MGIAALLSSVYAMRRILLLPAFGTDAWLQLAIAEKASNAFVVPTKLSRIVARLDEESCPHQSTELSTLRAIAYGGGKMSLELIERALNQFPETAFTNAYALTKTSSTIAQLGPEDHREAHASEDPAVRARLASVGRPLPSIELEIGDEEGKPLPAGERGESYVRGNRSPLNTANAARWMPTAGSPPGMPGTSTKQASCSCRVGLMM